MQNKPKLVILTGSGISAESGINTFRGQDGLWENHRIEEVATYEAFLRDPKLVQSFYNQRRQQLLSSEISPNAAHYALAELEKIFAEDMLVITQNIDDLHERAGQRHLLHMHGELLKMRCINSNQLFSIHGNINEDLACPCCHKNNTLRPDIVWFGEMPYHLDEIYDALQACDLFVAIGTSGHVYPAAGFVALAKQSGATCIEINLEPSIVNNQFDETIIGPATHTVPQWVHQLKHHYLTSNNIHLSQHLESKND